jgi:UDP-glucose 4-epimerase
VLGTVLLTGGAGYIGTHCVYALLGQAQRICVLDNLSTSTKAYLPQDAIFYQGDILDTALIDKICTQEKVTAIIHLAAKSVISESISEPIKYYDNNVVGTLNLLKACDKHQVPYFVYSSSASVYGLPKSAFVREDAPLMPQNPYGQSKLISERMITDIALSTGLKYVNFRYFNVAGADPQQRCGQITPNATHLIKVAVEAALGKRDALPVFGRHHGTPDGTCIRDFIHVSDLADAHVQGLKYLSQGGDSATLNCGYGQGHSVQEVIVTLESILGHRLNVKDEPNRPGDLAQVVADNHQIKQLLNWQPQYHQLKTILETALSWEKNL